MDLYNSLKYTFILLFSLSLFTQCKSQSDKKEKSKNGYKNSETYDFSEPKVIKLPQALDEISGITYYAKDTSVFAVIDEDGLLFKIPLKNPTALKEWVFDKPRDFEDIILKDSVFYVMVSNGDIDILSFKGKDIHVEKVDFPNASKKNNEFEALYYDSATNRVVLMCKNCEQDDKMHISSFYLSDSAKEYQPLTPIETTSFKENKGGERERIKPSAAAIDPVTKSLYVLCSVNKLVFVQDTTGKISEVIKLNPKIYKQPEGMCFTPQGDLIISNEFGGSGSANLLLLKNKKRL